MVDHCRSTYPNEACGIFSGRDGVAEKIYKMPNVESSPVSYLADPGAQFLAMKEMRENGEIIVSIYHSHPHSPPYPSGKDVELAFYPEAVYIIVGLDDINRPETMAYAIRDGKVRGAEIHVGS